MTYSAFDTSAESAQPVWLYVFTQGVTTHRYTNQPETVSHAGHDHAASAIEHGNIEMNGDLSKDKLTVKLPRLDAFALQFVSDVQDEVCRLAIYRGHGTDPDGEFVEWWVGSVGGAELDGATVKLECISIHSLMRQPGLRRRYTKTCPHTHYGRGCNLNRMYFAVPGTLTAMSGIVLTVPEAASYADHWFRGGMVEEPGGVLRWIIAHAGSQITLLRPFHADVFAALSGSPGSLPVSLFPGCDRSEETCNTKFDNLDNCGCISRIPSRNPYNGSSVL